MARNVLAFVVGLAVMVAFIVLAQTASFGLLSRSFVFRNETLDPSGSWLLLQAFLGFVGALLGGLAAISTGRRPQPVLALASFVIAFGLVTGIAESFAVRPPAPTPDVAATMSLAELQQYTGSPVWFRAAMPVVGFVGVMLGGRDRRREA